MSSARIACLQSRIGLAKKNKKLRTQNEKLAEENEKLAKRNEKLRASKDDWKARYFAIVSDPHALRDCSDRLIREEERFGSDKNAEQQTIFSPQKRERDESNDIEKEENPTARRKLEY
jgi:FtsZ-binding cell division protein ZapB